jgi:hypothetical protein
MISSGVHANHQALNHLTHAHVKAGRADAALKSLNAMTQHGLSPSRVSHNIILNAFCREGRIRGHAVSSIDATILQDYH